MRKTVAFSLFGYGRSFEGTLDFSTFPTVLLIVTMTRLSLNLA